MRVFTEGLYDIFVASDHHTLDLHGLEDMTVSEAVYEKIQGFLGGLDKLEREYLQLYTQVTGCRIGCLVAHGVESDEGWCYWNGNRCVSVQRWIDRYEKQYGVLVLLSCNVHSHTPKSEKSLLVLPDRTFSLGDIWGGVVCIDLIHPMLGELDPIIEHALRLLKKEVRAAS